MTNSLISVAIPAYNYAHFLPRAVESVMLQLVDNAELLVIVVHEGGKYAYHEVSPFSQYPVGQVKRLPSG